MKCCTTSMILYCLHNIEWKLYNNCYIITQMLHIIILTILYAINRITTTSNYKYVPYYHGLSVDFYFNDYYNSGSVMCSSSM